MKKKNIIIGAIILIIIIGIVLLLTLTKRKHNTFIFPTTIEIKNNTKTQLIDTMMMVVLNKIMLLDTIKVDIYKYNNKLDTRDTELAGYIIKNPFAKHSYMLYVNDYLNINTIEVLVSHESIHIKQMEDLKLTVYLSGYMWKGDVKSFKDVKYEERPHEIEAYNGQAEIKRKLEKLFYK